MENVSGEKVCGSQADLRGKLVVVKDRLKQVCVLCKVWQLRFVVGVEIVSRSKGQLRLA